VPGSLRIEGAGHCHRSGESSTHWVEHLRSDHLSVGTYSIAAAGHDDQVPHAEDEVYLVTAGRARLSTSEGETTLEPGDAMYVAAGEPHRFVDISDDFAAIVVFAPPETPPG